MCCLAGFLQLHTGMLVFLSIGSTPQFVHNQTSSDLFNVDQSIGHHRAQLMADSLLTASKRWDKRRRRKERQRKGLKADIEKKGGKRRSYNEVETYSTRVYTEYTEANMRVKLVQILKAIFLIKVPKNHLNFDQIAKLYNRRNGISRVLKAPGISCQFSISMFQIPRPISRLLVDHN